MADLGLATAAATANQVKSILNLIPEEMGRPKFGYAVDPEKEGRCPYIEVFMACHGRKLNVTYNLQLRRGRFAPTETPLAARAGFGQDRGKPVGQEDILDENGYILPDSLVNAPLATLSNECRLNLNFVYRNNVISKGVATAGEKVSDAGTTLVNATTNTPAWWQTWRGSSPSKQSTESE